MVSEEKKNAIKAILEADGINANDGHLEKLVEHVDKHEYFLGEKVKFSFTWSDALFSWYENIYIHILGYLNNRVLLFCFKNKKPIELFFDISHEWYMIAQDSEREPYVHDAARSMIFNRSTKNILLKRICELLI